jgi:hypothetical protein
MLSDWHDFYTLLGTAGAALVALLFVAASIGANFFTSETASGTSTFMSPVVFHYTNILFLSLIALIPDLTMRAFGGTIAVAAAGSLVYSIVIFVRVWRHSAADVFDRLAYGSAPMVSYSAGVVTAWLIFNGAADVGLHVLAAAALLLLIVNMRNAWDLMLSLSRRNAQQRQAAETPRPSQPPSPSKPASA